MVVAHLEQTGSRLNRWQSVCCATAPFRRMREVRAPCRTFVFLSSARFLEQVVNKSAASYEINMYFVKTNTKYIYIPIKRRKNKIGMLPVPPQTFSGLSRRRRNIWELGGNFRLPLDTPLVLLYQYQLRIDFIAAQSAHGIPT